MPRGKGVRTVRHIERIRVGPDSCWRSVLRVQSKVFGGYSRECISAISPDFTGGVLIPARDVECVVARVDVQVVHFDTNI